MVCFVARLTPHVTYVKLCTAANVLCVAWGVGGVFALTLRCDLAKPWITIGERCTNLVSLRILRVRKVWRANKQTVTSLANYICLWRDIGSYYTGFGLRTCFQSADAFSEEVHGRAGFCIQIAVSLKRSLSVNAIANNRSPDLSRSLLFTFNMLNHPSPQRMPRSIRSHLAS